MRCWKAEPACPGSESQQPNACQYETQPACLPRRNRRGLIADGDGHRDEHRISGAEKVRARVEVGTVWRNSIFVPEHLQTSEQNRTERSRIADIEFSGAGQREGIK